MPKKRPDPPTPDESIVHIVRNNKPATVKELVRQVQLECSLPQEEILKHIVDLESHGKIVLKEHPANLSYTLEGYLFSTRAYWYWTIIVLAATTAFLVFTVPENAYPIVYARYLLGSIFVLALPGYSFIKALFPKRELDNIERTALSIVMSIALVPITGLFLGYTPWGIRVTPVTLSLLALTIALATAGVVREHQAKLEYIRQHQ